MCHEKYHHDPDLRAVANYLSGLPSASSSETRERSQTVSALLLNTAAAFGLRDYVETACGHLTTGERSRLLTKLKAISSRLQQEALDMLYANQQGEPPF